eukprot:364883-Hanusia_phi.AAC.1
MSRRGLPLVAGGDLAAWTLYVAPRRGPLPRAASDHSGRQTVTQLLYCHHRRMLSLTEGQHHGPYTATAGLSPSQSHGGESPGRQRSQSERRCHHDRGSCRITFDRTTLTRFLGP